MRISADFVRVGGGAAAAQLLVNGVPYWSEADEGGAAAAAEHAADCAGGAATIRRVDVTVQTADLDAVVLTVTFSDASGGFAIDNFRLRCAASRQDHFHIVHLGRLHADRNSLSLSHAIAPSRIRF